MFYYPAVFYLLWNFYRRQKCSTSIKYTHISHSHRSFIIYMYMVMYSSAYRCEGANKTVDVPLRFFSIDLCLDIKQFLKD